MNHNSRKRAATERKRTQARPGSVHIAAFRDNYAYQSAFQRCEKYQEYLAQHGPVRVIMQGGKPGPDAPQ